MADSACLTASVPVMLIDAPIGDFSGQTAEPCAPSLPLPCLLLTFAPEEEKVSARLQEKLLGSRTAIARKADTLRRNLQDLIDRVGIERIGFTTHGQ